MNANKNEILISVRDLKKYYKGDKIKALDGVSTQIHQGEVVVIVGPSGAGKTTLLNILGGMDTLSTGTVMLDGQEISAMNKKQLTNYRRHDVGFVFQFYNLVQNLTAVENVELASEICKNPLDPKKTLEQVGLGHRLDNFPAQLSGGEQQRVAIARALAMDPRILFFDEPTSALDPELTGEALKIIRELAHENMTMVIVTHEMAFARDVAEHVIFMDGGVIVEQGDPHQVIDHPTQARTRQFLQRYSQD